MFVRSIQDMTLYIEDILFVPLTKMKHIKSDIYRLASCVRTRQNMKTFQHLCHYIAEQAVTIIVTYLRIDRASS